MKRMIIVLSVSILFTLGACTLPAPGVQAPTAIVAETDTPESVEAAPSNTPETAAQPEVTDTALPPTEAPPSATPTKPPLPSETPTPTQGEPQPEQSQPTNTQPAPTASTTPADIYDPSKTYGEPDYENPMEFPNYWEWATAGTSTLPNTEYIRLQFDDGNLLVTGKRFNWSTWWFSAHYVRDGFIEMTYNTEECSGEDAYGMIFRGPPHKAGVSYGYIVFLTCDGQFGMYRLDDADPWQVEDLVEVQSSSAIDSGSDLENVIGVRLNGDQFTIYANGIRVAQVEDDTFENGRLGVFVRSARPNIYTYRLQNLAFWTEE